jgi:hypothetical protein
MTGSARRAFRRKRSKRVFDVRVGDVWVFLTNTTTLSREIVGIDDPSCRRPYIYYRTYGSPYEQACLFSTFRRWWRGARLEFCTEGEDRDEFG